MIMLCARLRYSIKTSIIGMMKVNISIKSFSDSIFIFIKLNNYVGHFTNRGFFLNICHLLAFHAGKSESCQISCISTKKSLTFHDINDTANISFFDDQTASCILYWIHTVDNLTNLSDFQVFHKIVVKNGIFYQLSGPATDNVNDQFRAKAGSNLWK